jgi:hypothetical protein
VSENKGALNIALHSLTEKCTIKEAETCGGPISASFGAPKCRVWILHLIFQDCVNNLGLADVQHRTMGRSYSIERQKGNTRFC